MSDDNNKSHLYRELDLIHAKISENSAKLDNIQEKISERSGAEKAMLWFIGLFSSAMVTIITKLFNVFFMAGVK